MAKKVILGVCTSGTRLNVAVAAGGKVFQARKKVFNQELFLFPLVKSALARAGAGLRSVDTVCAVRGPGRFTGIRISLTLAGTLKALGGALVYTATLFEVLALQARESADFKAWAARNPGGRLAALLHAFKDEYFCQFFGLSGKPDGEPVWLKAEALKELLAASGAIYAVGDAEEEPGIYGLLPPGAAAAPAALSRVKPGYIIKAALAGRCRSLKPLYLKPAKYELENNISYGKGRRLADKKG
ncbi:MAG: tRNA (adenosine(37)-N6)-threonylcarbamoyltransferase complex dimerization subunit type 1 TsaB [Elusimicrobiales bacterium]|nr:tRNA (adenosine(37)-N6)-threonylcarbamoyltransferase complex dimerization subunit type 1 TsaB [Elusimicrobiales bacterium]